MDPNEAYKNWCRALLEEDKEAACEAYEALRGWLERGGFEPDWRPQDRKQFFQFNPRTGTLQ